MPCYHPLIGVPTNQETVNGKKKLLVRQSKNSADFEKELEKNKEAILLPCGKCIGCRLDYSRKWADRMMLELEETKKAVFLTLTYDEDHIIKINDNVTGEEVGTLFKKDCQLFMKRLRKEFNDFRIRFFASGEYGSKTQRPHYHFIIFGIDFNDIGDCVVWKRSELGDYYYLSDRIARVWQKGNILVANVSWKTCAYVSRYVTKKINGKLKEIVYGTSGRQQEFSLMSRMPGIGMNYLRDHPECLDNSYINISTDHGGKKITIPKYFIDTLKLTDPEKFDILKEERKKFAQDKILIELQETDLKFVDYLEVKEMQKNAKLKALKRDKVR